VKSVLNLLTKQKTRTQQSKHAIWHSIGLLASTHSTASPAFSCITASDADTKKGGHSDGELPGAHRESIRVEGREQPARA